LCVCCFRTNPDSIYQLFVEVAQVTGGPYIHQQYPVDNIDDVTVLNTFINQHSYFSFGSLLVMGDFAREENDSIQFSVKFDSVQAISSHIF